MQILHLHFKIARSLTRVLSTLAQSEPVAKVHEAPTIRRWGVLLAFWLAAVSLPACWLHCRGTMEGGCLSDQQLHGRVYCDDRSVLTLSGRLRPLRRRPLGNSSHRAHLAPSPASLCNV
eukprot:2513029-Rhodomonas_salina.4